MIISSLTGHTWRDDHIQNRLASERRFLSRRTLKREFQTKTVAREFFNFDTKVDLNRCISAGNFWEPFVRTMPSQPFLKGGRREGAGSEEGGREGGRKDGRTEGGRGARFCLKILFKNIVFERRAGREAGKAGSQGAREPSEAEKLKSPS